MKFQFFAAKICVRDFEARPPWRNSPRIGAEVGCVRKVESEHKRA